MLAKKKILLLGNAIFDQATMEEKKGLILTSKTVQVKQVIYNFVVQNLVTFEGYIKFKGDIPLSAYIEFETNAPADLSLGLEDRNIFAISYVIIFAFHPYLKLNRVIIERSFGHSLEKSTSLDYLTREQLLF